MTASPRQARHLPAFILLVLAERALHGNAIRAALLERLPGLKADVGAVYRTLQGLEADGCVAGRWDTEGRGPARKIYELTPAGWERLDFWEEDIRMRLGFLNAFLETLAAVRKRR
jgi:DNA-binding PadR family transcriptional regulator